jgi:hypothetical protein
MVVVFLMPLQRNAKMIVTDMPVKDMVTDMVQSVNVYQQMNVQMDAVNA